MSTILRALQKNKLGQNASIQVKTKENPVWKILILLGIALIVILLSVLLYIRLTPTVKPEVVIIEPVLKPVSKIVFQTQKMPENKQAQKVIYIAKQSIPPKKSVSPKKQEVKQIVIPTANVEAQEIEEAKKIAEKEQQEMDDVSDKMKQRFALAVSLTDDEDEATDDIMNTKNDGLESADGSDIRDMSSSFQRAVPPISYESHVYSSISENRWIKINGEKLKEGDLDRSGQLKIVEIEPQRTIFRLGSQSFSLESLVDWKGH